MTTLRPYQTSAVEALRQALRGGSSRIVLYSPTGSGKTEMALAMIAGARAKGKRVAFVCNRVELVVQAARRFTAAGIAHGIIQSANTVAPNADVVVCSIQTVARRGMPRVDLIVIDEAHACAGSKDYRAMIARHNALPIIGLSATPFSRGLGRQYDEIGGELFERIVVAATIPDLIRDGFLVDCDIYAPTEPDMRGYKLQRNAAGEQDYSDLDAAEAMDMPSLTGDIVDHWLRLADHTPTVCFASSISHSQHLVDQFRAVGVSAEHIDCYTEQPERQAIMQRVRDGETKVISNVSILAEGWDFPACQTMILARPTRSLIRYIQMAGRVLRPYPGKERALILDHSGTVLKLGFPTDELPLELDDGKPKSGKSEPEKREPTKCASCSMVKPPKSRVCPGCGFAPQVSDETEVAPGELKAIERRKTWNKQETWSQLLALCMAYGYSKGWASNKYREVFGVWPRGLRSDLMDPCDEVKSWVKSRQIAFAKSRSNAA